MPPTATIPLPGFTQAAPGIFERIGAPPPNAPDIAAYYAANIAQICQRDRPHYDKLMAHLRTAHPAIFGAHQAIFAFGGGLPKLESYLAPREILVIDDLAQTWRNGFAAFLQHYPWCPEVGFLATAFSPDFISVTVRSHFPRVTVRGHSCPRLLATFTHVIEHLPADFAAACIRAAIREFSTVLIYGPCIDACQGPDWVHAPIPDHRTFHTFAALQRVVTDAGGRILHAERWSDDHLVIATHA